MKSKNGFRKVKFIKKSFSLWLCAIYVLFVLGIVFLLFKSVERRNIKMVLISSCCCILIIFVHVCCFKKRKSRILENNLVWLAYQNNWIEVKNEIVTYKPYIAYKYANEHIYIAFGLDGSLKSHQFRDEKVEISLSDSLQMACIDKIEQNSRIIYEFAEDSYFNPFECDEYTDYNTLCTSEKIFLNEKMAWNWRTASHALIVGGTGSGKTCFLLHLLKGFKSIFADVRIIDAKKGDLYKLGNTWKISSVCEDNQIAKILREAQEEMDRRYLDMKQIGVDYYTLGLVPVFIVFDEAMAWFGGSADEKIKKEARKHMLNIVAKGRQAGVNICLCMQRCDTKFVDGAIRDQLGLRVALGNMSKTGLGMVFGNDFNDIRPRFTGKGEGLIFINDGQMKKPMDYKAPRMNSGAWKIN